MLAAGYLIAPVVKRSASWEPQQGTVLVIVYIIKGARARGAAWEARVGVSGVTGVNTPLSFVLCPFDQEDAAGQGRWMGADELF